MNAQSLLEGYTTTAVATRPALWPVWLGLAGAALLLILCLLRIWCPGGHARVAPVAAVEPPVIAAPVVRPIPQGAGVAAETRAGRPALVVYFEVAKSDVTNDLAAEAAPLKAYLASHPGARLSVSGFNDPTGNAAFNAELSKSRAEKVGAGLAAAGIAADRIDLDKPAETTGTGDTNAESRRVEVTVKD